MFHNPFKLCTYISFVATSTRGFSQQAQKLVYCEHGSPLRVVSIQNETLDNLDKNEVRTEYFLPSSTYRNYCHFFRGSKKLYYRSKTRFRWIIFNFVSVRDP
uniref:Uncharacterized protein n=1 Tax=Cacopsylla melanoneura TaxID=428564 RepID=A0A8D8VPJ1_9HEMI